MIIAVRSDYSVLIRGLMPEHLALLQALPLALAEAGAHPWEKDPVSGPDSPEAREAREDWENFVRPELRDHCEGEIAVFLRDLATASQIDDSTGEDEEPIDDDDTLFFAGEDGHAYRLEIPPGHVEPWFGALNQARLAIEARFQFGDPASLQWAMATWPAPKRAAFWQSRLYAALQESLLACMEARFFPPTGENPGEA